ncbi:hypothetical protein [Microbacterium sp. XT11]|uniref:hypothetical protein n=1 Tax=Microbacterium sp. XT11 TaxID=367477 RepID=UPI000A648240|nr:hypothetical protein [Microbacterium sp. XT11]
MHDYLSPLVVGILFSLILIGWILSDLHNRKQERAYAARVAAHVAEMAVSMASSGECAKAWATDHGRSSSVHLCARPYGHTGPCDCGTCPPDDADGIDR